MSEAVSFRVNVDPGPQPRHKFRALVPARDAIRDIYDRVAAELGDAADDDEEEFFRRFRAYLVKATKAAAYLSSETESKVDGYKRAIVNAWRACRKPPFDGPIELTVTAFTPRPKSRIKKRSENLREYDVRAPAGSGSGDWDNFGKAVSDALNCEAWKDDCQVAVGIVRKLMCDAREEPHVAIVIRPLDPTEIDDAGALEHFTAFGTIAREIRENEERKPF